MTLGSLVASVTVVVNWFSRWCFRGGVQLTLGSLVAAVTVVVLVWMSVRGGLVWFLVLLRLVLLWLSAAAAELVLIPAGWGDCFFYL